jgi:hypothetical protein
MSRSRRFPRHALLLAPMLAAASGGAHAVSVNATIDGLAYYCSEADNLQITVEQAPIWNWTCGIQEIICVQNASDSTFELDTNTLALACVQMTPYQQHMFYDGFE